MRKRQDVTADITDTIEALRRAEERGLKEGLTRMNALWKQYKQALQKGDNAHAKQLRRMFYKEAFVNLSLATSPIDLLFPDPKLQSMMDKITQELNI